MKNILIMSIIVFIYSGCSSKYPVTFDSKPQGARIVCNGTDWGYSPITLYYEEKVKESSSLNLRACSANWASGETRHYDTVDLKQFPNGVITTLSIPSIDEYIKEYSSAEAFCNSDDRLELLRNYSTASSCKNEIRDRLLKQREYEKAYNWGLIDKATLLIQKGEILQAYRAGFIDKDTAREEMLKHGQIIEAYEGKLIDKDTADLYLKKQAIANANHAAEQQVQATKDAASQASSDAFWNAAMQNDARQNAARNNQFRKNF